MDARAAQCARLNLTTVYTGVDMDYCFAVREGNTILYSILSKIIRRIPGASVNAALAYYSAAGGSDAAGWLPARPAVTVLLIVSLVLLVIVLILVFRIRKLKRPPEKSSGA